VAVKRDSSARLYNAYVVTGNTSGGIQLNEESSAYFGPGTVKDNTGGMDLRLLVHDSVYFADQVWAAIKALDPTAWSP